jgi:hypothetical protein
MLRRFLFTAGKVQKANGMAALLHVEEVRHPSFFFITHVSFFELS